MKTPLRPLSLATPAFILAFIATMAVAPALAFATTSVRILADVGGCFEGSEPASGNLTVTWTDKNGHTKSQFSTTGSLSRDWRPPLADCQNHVVAFGDLIHVHVTSPDDVTHDFRIQPISATFHRGTNRVQGHAPVTGGLSVTVGRPSLADGRIPKMCTLTPTRTAEGNFSVDTTNCVAGYDTIGGDVAVVVWNTPGGDFQRSFIRAPYVEAWLGRAKVDGYLDAGTSTSLALRTSGGVARGSTTVASSKLNGRFQGTFHKNGVAVNARAGDVIHGTWDGTHNYRVLPLAISISASSITGVCNPATPYGLAVVRSGKVVANEDGVTDGAGATAPLDFSESGLDPGDTVVFTCMGGGGDRTTLERVVS